MPEGGDDDGDADGRVLSADELDISEQEEVASLGDGRFVVGSDGPPEAPDVSTGNDASSTDRPAPAEQPQEESEDGADDSAHAAKTVGDADEITGRDVKSWLADELVHHDSAYAYHIAAKADGDVANQQLATDDIGAAFDGLLVWYARQVATDTPVDEALGILLSESGVRVRYPTARLVEYLDAKDLGPEDSISDLVAAVSEDDGLVFTKRQ
jgi:hypothetical protein